jgi:hypothetical protein
MQQHGQTSACHTRRLLQLLSSLQVGQLGWLAVAGKGFPFGIMSALRYRFSVLVLQLGFVLSRIRIVFGSPTHVV